jgi:hypothetical protein
MGLRRLFRGLELSIRLNVLDVAHALVRAGSRLSRPQIASAECRRGTQECVRYS